MSFPWVQRKARLRALLQSQGNEDDDGVALDRLLHGQSVIGKTSKTTEVDALRFQDRDMAVVGTLEHGQFGIIHVVNCRLDGRVYVRKSTEKHFAMRTRDQCSPQFERDLLLQARKMNSPWAPHLLCAYQTLTHLNLVMDYAEGGTLWDLLESSPHEGRVLEADLRWWTPQIVSAIHWCHSQGFVHRDVKPHNFVLTPSAHVLLIDFGSAAPLLEAEEDGTRKLPRKYCSVPCGTCDYISPEILETHERALVAFEMEDDTKMLENDTYGLETDWWSLGAMLYEMAYGVAPFYADDIRRTYSRIMDHTRSLRFSPKIPVSAEYQDFLRKLLTNAEFRLGRHHISEITDHPIFDDTLWSTLSTRPAPQDLHIPQFIYGDPQGGDCKSELTDPQSQAFGFSALFQSSVGSSPGLSFLHSSPSPAEEARGASFIGFSWGPPSDAFPAQDANGQANDNLKTPRPVKTSSSLASVASTPYLAPPTMATAPHTFSTPVRPTSNASRTPFQTLPRTSGTLRRRDVSDREAMKQLVDCVGMSARKKVLESGRKPRRLPSFSNLTRLRSGSHSAKLKLVPPPIEIVPIAVGLSSPEDEMDTDTGESDGPPSPSPSPRPGSALSMMSRRSTTPTMTMSGMFSTHRALSNSLLTGNTTSRLRPSISLEDDTLDELEAKHESMMEDIDDIELRLTRFAQAVGGGSHK